MRDGSDQRLRQARLRAGYETPADFIAVLGKSEQSTYYGFENNSRSISIGRAKRYAPLLKVRWQWLYEDDGPMIEPPRPAKAAMMVPRLSWVSAGKLTPQAPIENVDVEDYVEVADLPKGDWVAFTVRGSSMNLVAPDGSTILVNRNDTVLKTGNMYVFQGLESGEATFKRYRDGMPPRLQPYSTDPDEETINAPASLAVFGRARRVVTDI